ncbi:hypothetical protein REPUB_Repub10bG0085800 [Reevesia pubescens]
MGSKLLQPSIPTSQAIPSIPKITKMITAAQKLAPALQSTTKSIRLFEPPSGFKHILKCTTKVGEDSSSLVNDVDDIDVGEKEKETLKHRTVDQIKADIYRAIKGINRGIFGVQSARKSEIEGLVELLESQTPMPDPALHLEKVVYSTITILGAKRTKLGLRHFLTLGDIYQTIDVAKAKAIIEVKFDIRGLSLLNGQLTIEATFKIASKSRVDICYDKSTITPDQLRNVLRKKYDLLLSIFNPEDDTMMIGRDDKGNTIVFERSE